MQKRTIILSSSPLLPRFKPLPWWQRILSWIIPFKQAYVVVHDGQRCYTNPKNLQAVREILEKYYEVKLVPTLSVENKQ